MAQSTLCKFENCNKKSRPSGWCTKHHDRIRLTGTPWRLCMDCGTNLPEDSGRARRCERCDEANVCTVEDCNRKPVGNGLCKMHWKRNNRYGDPLGKSDFKQIKRDCQVPGCARPYHANGYCSSHEYKNARYGDPLHEGIGSHTGRHRMEAPSYSGMHKRIFYDRGSASQFKCVDCGGRAQEWSYDGSDPNELMELVRGSLLAYSTDQSFYSARCVRCHRKKDLGLMIGVYGNG